MNIIRSLPVVAALLAVSGAEHAARAAEETASPSNPAAKPFEHTIEINAGLGFGGMRASNADWSYDGAAIGLQAMYFSPIGLGFGGRATAMGDSVLGPGNSADTLDLLVAFRPWQRDRRYQILPTIFAGGGSVSATRQVGGGLWSEGPREFFHARATTALAGASLDLHVGHFVMSAEYAGRVALAGDAPIDHATAYTAMLRFGGDIEF